MIKFGKQLTKIGQSILPVTKTISFINKINYMFAGTNSKIKKKYSLSHKSQIPSPKELQHSLLKRKVIGQNLIKPQRMFKRIKLLYKSKVHQLESLLNSLLKKEIPLLLENLYMLQMLMPQSLQDLFRNKLQNKQNNKLNNHNLLSLQLLKGRKKILQSKLLKQINQNKIFLDGELDQMFMLD